MTLGRFSTAIALIAACVASARADSTDVRTPRWHIGIEEGASYVPPTNIFLDGDNPLGQPTSLHLMPGIKAGFNFGSGTRFGQLYPKAYQGIGVAPNLFDCKGLLGNPVSVYVYQGAPIVSHSKLSLGYEWEFGIAAGWKHFHAETAPYNNAVSTPVTAHMGLSARLSYQLTPHVALTVGARATHFSNGNTSWPNSGVNSMGLVLGASYTLNPGRHTVSTPDADLLRKADEARWIVDILPYASVRKRVVLINAYPQLCPGRFAVAGLQTALLRKFNRFAAAGVALDAQWDESADLARNWAGGNDDYIKFYRPSVAKQFSIGFSAHGQLTMAMFTLDAGIGVNAVNPFDESRFYQMLALKTFVTQHIYFNTGYRLGNFRHPQNLMLGIGIRW